MSGKPCVLAYSGGLDTTAIVLWLRERGYEVHAVLVDVGQGEDLPALCSKALRLGASSAVVRDARPAMFETVVPMALGLAARYEGTYRLGTALARPFIAVEQVRLARRMGGATLVHGATGKGNDQIRFEYAYRTLAPDCPVLAPWKEWDFAGRRDLLAYVVRHGADEGFEPTKDFSLDENLWHLSIEGGPLENPAADLNVEQVLAAHASRFAGGVGPRPAPPTAMVTFDQGVPVAVNGATLALPELIARLNRDYRAAPWAWDLVIENRCTGIKSRGLYINPAAALLHSAADGLARSCLNKPSYEAWCDLGRQYAGLLYRGEYFSDQRRAVEAAGRALMSRLTGAVTMQTSPALHATRIDAPQALFRHDRATFERSDYAHADAAGFIRLGWLGAIGRSIAEESHACALETGDTAASDVRCDQSLPGGRLVPAAV